MAEEEAYHAVDAITPTLKGGAITGGAGLLIAAVQATLVRQNVGAFATFTRFGGTVTTFAAMGATYEFVRNASANLREKKDAYNEGFAGFLSGSLTGLRVRSLPAVLGYGAGLGVIMAAFHVSGRGLKGVKDPEVDEFERKLALRKNRRRPIQETIDELGEGRGIRGPGYEERRRQRIKDAYGIDVPTPQ